MPNAYVPPGCEGLGGGETPAENTAEASAVAAVYALVLAVLIYRQVRLRELPDILLRCGVTPSVVFLLIGTSMALS